MLILWKRSPFILWESIPFFYGKTPFILWKCSLFSMKISLYSMEKLSHSACSKGYHLLNVENSDRHCIIFIELPNNGRRSAPILFALQKGNKRRSFYRHSLEGLHMTLSDFIGAVSLICSIISMCFSYVSYKETQKKNDR